MHVCDFTRNYQLSLAYEVSIMRVVTETETVL